MIYVYRGTDFDPLDAKVQKQIEELSQRIQNDASVIELFDRVYPYLKRRIEDYRLIAQLRQFPNSCVLCLLGVFHRSDSAYERFLNNPETLAARWHLPDEKTLLDFLRDQASALDGNTREALPENLRLWLEPPGWAFAFRDPAEILIYEGNSWVSSFRGKYLDVWQTYHELLVRLVNGEDPGVALDGNSPFREISGLNKRSIIFCDLATDDPARRVIFLVAPRFTEDRIPDFSTYDCFLERPLRLETLSKLAFRSYPDYILADDLAWKAIQSDEDTNLALSPEEERFLHEVSSPLENAPAQPIFINGRAGTGKSTMLAYLFADYFARKLRPGPQGDVLEGDLLFLTYSERLLDCIRGNVARLLHHHSRFLSSGETKSELFSLEPCFQIFQRLALSLLPLQKRENFDKNAYVDFNRFRELYQHTSTRKQDIPNCLNLKERDRFSPELAWHVIRAFIKGRDVEDTTPDDYREVSHRERDVDIDDYRIIYETIWSKWYRTLREKGFWDDQDIIREVLTSGPVKRRYAVIFCDEAQDFTRIEFGLIMGLSIFSGYDLGYIRPRELPFAFAGDPLQTVNPTGFRWSAIGAAFYESIVRALDPEDRWHLEIRPPEQLKCNYRSTPSIVRLANLVQLWRTVLLGRDLKPQEPWRELEDLPPERFIIGENFKADELKGTARDAIFIVPCEEGGEASFVSNDPILRDLIPPTSDNGPPKNVFSPAAAKGLEFQRTIIFRFGEQCAEEVWTTMPDAQPLDVHYFFNKLYVALTRAKKRLAIVDSPEGERRLWKHMADLSSWIERAAVPSIWKDDVQGAALAPNGSFGREVMSDNPLAVAIELKNKGLEYRHSGLVRRARQYFIEVGYDREAMVCEAYSLKYDGEHSKAGHVFLKLGERDESWKCFWEGECWPDLLEWYANHQDVRRNDGVPELARFMSQRTTDSLSNFTAFLLHNTQLASAAEPQWSRAIQDYKQRISRLGSNDLDSKAWSDGGLILESLEDRGHTSLIAEAANCFYRSGNYGSAIRCWKRIGATNQRLYYLAEAATASFPQTLHWLSRAGDKEGFLTEWNRAAPGQQVSADLETRRFVASLFEEKRDHWNAFNVYLSLGDAEKAIDTLALAYPALTHKERWESARRLCDQLIDKGRLVDAIEQTRKYVGDTRFQENEKLAVGIKLLRAQKLSPNNSTTNNVEQRDLIEEIAGTARRSERRAISNREIGLALERMARHVTALRFYESMLREDDMNADDREWARRRWLFTKLKQVAYFERPAGDDRTLATQLRQVGLATRGTTAGPRTLRGREAYQELQDKAREWNVPLATLNEIPEYPDLGQKPDPVEGLPAGTQLEALSSDKWQFRIGTLEISFDRIAKRVLLLDRSDLGVVEIDAANLRLNALGDLELQQTRMESGEIEFRISSRNWQGLVRGGDEPCVELDLGGGAGIITIQLRQS